MRSMSTVYLIGPQAEAASRLWTEAARAQRARKAPPY